MKSAKVTSKFLTFSYLFTYIILFSISKIVFADDVSSTNFKIEGDNLSAGSGTGNSTNYSMTGDVNPFSDMSDSASYRQELGYNPRIQAYTPYAPILSNPSDYYDRLHLVIDPSNNPSDTLFAVIVSSDNFVTYVYLQSDNTLGSILGSEDYRTYLSLGGISGLDIIGLDSNTPYKAKVKALNGDFTETGYGPASTEVTTDVPYINFQIDNHDVSLGVLNLNSVSTTSGVTLTVNTNSTSGYQVYVNDTGNGVNGGLYDGISYLILSSDTTLFPGVSGYGAQASSGTANINPKYDLAGDNVGALTISTNSLFSNAQPVSSESTTVIFKATISPSVTSGDYTDIVYFTITPVL